MTLPRAGPNLEPLRPYKAASSAGVKHNLSANDGCLGPSPVAVAATIDAMQSVERRKFGIS